MTTTTAEPDHPESVAAPSRHRAQVRPSPEEREFRRQIGRRLRLRRSWLRLAQQDVAGRADVTRDFVSAIETGARRLDAWRLHLIADALGVTLDWLLFGPDEELTDPNPGTGRTRRSQQEADRQQADGGPAVGLPFARN